jgi:hypothetical protein
MNLVGNIDFIKRALDIYNNGGECDFCLYTTDYCQVYIYANHVDNIYFNIFDNNDKSYSMTSYNYDEVEQQLSSFMKLRMKMYISILESYGYSFTKLFKEAM